MERKLKIMGIYTGLLFFVSVLLILVTSFSNNKMDPSYDVETEQEKNQIVFDRTMEQSVNILTENNRILTEKVEELKKQLSEKEKIISEYENKYNQDVSNLYKSLSLYTMDKKSEAKKIFEGINRENLMEAEKEIYDILEKDLI